MRMSCNPQSILGSGFEVWLLFSELHPFVPTIVARVYPRRFGPYGPTVACTFLLVTKAVSLLCSLTIAGTLANRDTGLARCLT